MKVRLGDLTKIKTGKLDANAASDDGQYPFFTCSIEPLKIATYSYDCECVLVAGNGDLNVKYYNGKFDAYQRTYIIEENGNGKLWMPYLYYFMDGYVEELRKQAIGGVIKYIKLGNLTEALIELPSTETQKEIVSVLEKAKGIVNDRKLELQKLDELVKARFVEMFEYSDYPSKTIGEVCVLRSGTTLDKSFELESGEMLYCKVSDMNLNGNSKYMTVSKTYVSADVGKKTAIPANSVIFPKRGGAIGTNKKRITLKATCVDLTTMGVTPNSEIDIQYLYQYFQNIDLGSLCDGSTIPQLNNKNIRPLPIKVPPISLQNEFATFVKQVDKSKFVVQQALDKAQTLFDSLMQQYFG